MTQTPDAVDLESMEDFFSCAPCGLLLCQPNGTIAAVNQTFLAWTGLERDTLVGQRRLDDLFTVPSRLYFATHCQPLLSLQGFVHEIAIDVKRHDGSVLPAFLHVMEKRDETGKVKLMRAALFDGTDRRRYEHELMLARRISEQAAKSKGDFLAMFAHEVRNPLAAVMMQLDLLEHAQSGSQHEKALARMRSSLSRMLALLNNMLEMSKLDAGKATLEDTPFRIRDVTQTVVHSLSALAEAKSLPLHVRIDERLSDRVRGDPVKLEQVLTNLVTNAIKFTESGAVTLTVTRLCEAPSAVHVRFAVRDTGIGIAPERQRDIFDEYVQADSSVSRRFGGTGLGLAITQKLLSLQQSELELQSSPGEGSTFSFQLRLHLADDDLQAHA